MSPDVTLDGDKWQCFHSREGEGQEAEGAVVTDRGDNRQQSRRTQHVVPTHAAPRPCLSVALAMSIWFPCVYQTEAPPPPAPKDISRAEGLQATMFSAQETQVLSLKVADGEEIISW